MTRLIPVLALLVGCSILNRPDDPDVGPRDAGPDGGDSMVDAPDPDVPDGEVPDKVCNIERADDSQDDEIVDCSDIECEGRSCIEGAADEDPPRDETACECRNGRAVELACGNTTDDDGDGTTDCGDFDCAGLNLEECCGFGSTPVHWPDALCPTDGWTEGDGDVLCDDTVLSEFMSAQPFALVWDECLSLALGATFEIDVLPNPTMDPNCAASDTTCDENVRLLIAERNLPRETGGRFLAELAVVAHASGWIEVVQGDTPIPDASTRVTGLTRLKIAFRPTTSDTGVPELRARVTYDPPDVAETELWEGFVVRLDDLITDGECINVPGFYLALEGLGDAIRINRFVANQAECSNPNLFRPTTDGILTPYDYMEDGTTSLELDPQRLIDVPSRRDEPSWATQALSSPTLLQSGGEWFVAAEASNDQPANEPAFRVGYAIAYRSNSATRWNEPLNGWSGGFDTPLVGNQPPSCLDGTCPTPEMPPFPSVRDPFLFEVGGEQIVAFVGEVDEAGESGPTEKFGIYVAPQSTLRGTFPALTLDPADVDECDSLRDPVVVPRPDAGGPTEFWLFYTCYDGLASRGIWVVPMTSNLGLRVIRDSEDNVVDPVLILAPESLNFGAGTLRSAEVVLDQADGRSVFGMWFLVGQQVGLATGAAKGEFTAQDETGDAPSFQLFEGNPVLQPTDRAFNRACSGCSIEGLAVTRIDPTTLRFLIARENDDEPARYDLLPLDQTWRNLARP